MTDDRLERELRERFGALRAQVEQATPGFGLPTRPLRRQSAALWPAAAAVLVLAVAAWLVFSGDEQSQSYTVDLAGAYWSAPTDFLLDTPGLDLLREVPEIDVHGFIPIPSQPEPETIDTIREPGRSQS